jgi:ribonuclease Y
LTEIEKSYKIERVFGACASRADALRRRSYPEMVTTTSTIIIIIIIVALSLALLVFVFFAGVFYRKKVAEKENGAAKSEAERILQEAAKAAEARKKEILLEAKEESIRTKNEAEREAKERRNETQRLEKRLVQKEETLDRKTESIEKKDDLLQKKIASVDVLKADVVKIVEKQQEELERISGLTSEQAKAFLLSSIEAEVRLESAVMIKDIESKARLEADKRAKDIVAGAIQRCAVDHVAETTVSVVNLPNDEMKGRIIGREGRNIRTLESLTGIDLIIDDTPEAVILSGFDPMRREIARIALEKLIIDGRVHPARIEEMVEKAKKEVEMMVREEGEAATFATGVHNIHPELVRLLGKMKFRTSYGQNVLKHSIEVAYLCGLMASELGADVSLAKRAGLLHDIGKSVDHDLEGTHVSIGAALCKKYKESDIIINAVESHHGDVEPTNIISIITQAADAISASRPGARRETLESYIKRLQKLEAIAEEFKGVEKSFAIQAGRELRIIIIPEEVSDSELTLLARDVAKKIESELDYPGQIKVNLIRETRAIEYAK